MMLGTGSLYELVALKKIKVKNKWSGNVIISISWSEKISKFVGWGEGTEAYLEPILISAMDGFFLEIVNGFTR